ncbi:MAG TPA: sugar ABC transporter substrate-binding protein, partial [Chloroflexota bacterium]|nr:sugar ABC transporter substrate-binding protein [Chloroflexota bacterium]
LAGVVGLAACGAPRGQGDSADQPGRPARVTGTVRFATWASGAQAEMKQQQLDAFNQSQSGVQAVLESSPNDYWTKMQTQFAASPEDVPEVFWQSGSYFLQFSNSGWHLDLGPYVKRDKFDLSKHNRQLEVEEYQGKLYALPYGTGGVVMYYNRSLFDAAGLSYPTDAWTWDEVRAAAQKLTRPGQGDAGGQWGFVAYPHQNETGYLPFVYANGGTQLDKDRTRVLLDQPASMAAFEWLTDNIYKHRIMPKPGELTRAPGQNDDFMTGKVAMMIAGTWRLSDYVLMQDFQWDMAHVPLSPSTKKRGTTFNENPVSIPKFTRNPEAAWAVAKFLNEEAAQKIMGASKRKAPTLKSAVSDPQGFLKPPPSNIKVAADLYAYAQALPFVACPAPMNDALTPELNAIYNGTKAPAEALRAAAQAGTAVLASHQCT